MERIYDLKVDNQNNIFACGVYNDSLDLDPSPFAVQLQYVTLASAEGYYVKLGSANICTSTSVSEENQNDNFSIFPNPSNGQIYFEGLKEKSTLKLYNQFGVLIVNKKIENAQLHLDLNGFTSGLYFLEVTNGSERKVEKIILMK